MEEVANSAVKEEQIETRLASIESDWAAFNLVSRPCKPGDPPPQPAPVAPEGYPAMHCAVLSSGMALCKLFSLAPLSPPPDLCRLQDARPRGAQAQRDLRAD